MVTQRLALVLIRILLALVAAVYGVLKLVIAPLASPLLGVPTSVAVELNTPISTNPTFARVAISVGILLAVSLAAVSIRGLIKEWRLYGHVAPFSSPTVISLMALFSCMTVYYFTVAVVAGAQWWYSGTLMATSIALGIYEGRQYADNGFKV
jgi:hypothetical protein